jgi:glycosyltransferase involved in cell wall biosynthesis
MTDHLRAEAKQAGGGRRRRLLALAVYPDTFAATRFRISAYGSALATAGIDLEVSPFLDAETLRAVQGGQPSPRAVGRFLRALVTRLAIAAERKRYDAVFVQREATMVGPPWLELLLAKLGVPFVYDIDDAVWLTSVPVAGSLRARFPRVGNFIRAAEKAPRLLRVANEVICGSEYLAAYAGNLNAHVTVIPTVTDLTFWKPLACRADGAFANRVPVIGWIGTPSTAPALRMVEPALVRLRDEGHEFVVRVRGAGAAPFEKLAHENLPWRAAEEIADFAEIDVGLAPMKDDEWSAGKCAFKQIQYMAVGVPHVSSLAGAAGDVLVDGENAFVAHNSDDWYRSIKVLLEDHGTRRRITEGGLRAAEARYSLQAQAPHFVRVIERAMGAPS